MQLWKKQKISAFKSSSKRSRVCLWRSTSSRFAAEWRLQPIRRRWSVNWAMRSYSSCAKQYQKFNVLIVFSIGIKEMSIVFADSSWLKANPEESLKNLRLDALSIPHYVIKKGRCHGVRHGKIEEQKEYQKAWNAWKRCSKRVDSQGEHFTGFHDRFLRDQVHRKSQLSIGWKEQQCIEMNELAKQNNTYHLTTEEFKIHQGDNGISFWTSQAKTRICDFDQIFELLSLSKTVFTASLASKLKNQFLHINLQEMTLFFKRFLVGHVCLELVEFLIFFKVTFFLLQLVSFTVDGDPLYPTGVYTDTFHTSFF